MTRQFNMAEYFLDDRIKEGLGDKVAVIADGQAYTYRQVLAGSNRVRHALLASGVHEEDRVLLALSDGIDFVHAFFGVLKAGAVFCMTNPYGTQEDFEYLMDYTKARAVICDSEQQEKFEALAQGQPRIKAVVGDVSLWSAAHSSDTDNAKTTPDSIAGWLFTSGTTGKPKGAVHRHSDFPFNTEHYAKGVLGLKPEDVCMSISRLFFGYATGISLMFPFAVGATAVLFKDKATPEKVCKEIQTHRVTVLGNVPTVIRQMVQEVKPNENDLSSLRVCISAGEALPSTVYAQWKGRGWCEILDGIGSAELFHVYISNRMGNVLLGSLGTLVTGYQAKICNDDAIEVPDGEVGRLWVKGESAALCYWDARKKSEETFRDGWVVSADLFRREKGVYFFAGRAGDMIKVKGQFMSPLEMEDCLLKHPMIDECAVIAAEDKDGMVIAKAFVVKKKPELDAADVQEFCKTHLAKYKYPNAVEFVDALPRNDRGKIMREALKTT